MIADTCSEVATQTPVRLRFKGDDTNVDKCKDARLLMEVALRWGNVTVSGVSVSCYANGDNIVRQGENRWKYRYVDEAACKVAELIGDGLKV